MVCGVQVLYLYVRKYRRKVFVLGTVRYVVRVGCQDVCTWAVYTSTELLVFLYGTCTCSSTSTVYFVRYVRTVRPYKYNKYKYGTRTSGTCQDAGPRRPSGQAQSGGIGAWKICTCTSSQHFVPKSSFNTVQYEM